MRTLKPIIATAVFVFMMAVRAFANDTLVTLGAGGLVPLQSSEIIMEYEYLEVSTHQITVRYVFRNSSDHDVDATVAFPLPELGGGTLYGEPIDLPSKSLINFIDFKVTVAGKPIEPKSQIRAFTADGSKDVTDRIREFGLPLSVIDQKNVDAVIKKMPSSQRQQLEDEELVLFEDTRDPISGILRKEYWPMWRMRVQYYWTQHFPAKRAIAVTHTYRPVVGGSYIVSSDDGSSEVKEYCGNAEAMSQIKYIKKEEKLEAKPDEIALLERTIQYILTTGNNWSGPIRSFHVSVFADSPYDIVMTCMKGLQRLTPTRYELVRSNFHPEQELDLLILQPKKR